MVSEQPELLHVLDLYGLFVDVRVQAARVSSAGSGT